MTPTGWGKCLTLPLAGGADGEWVHRAACRRRPADWWDFGDDGNRLAMAICRLSCRVRVECDAHDPEPAGVVRAGVAWTAAGKPAKLCHCGRPVVPKSGRTSDQCLTCHPPKVPLPVRRRGRPRRAATNAAGEEKTLR